MKVIFCNRDRWRVCLTIVCITLLACSCQSHNIGDIVTNAGVKAYVAEMDADGHPTLLMTTDEVVAVSNDSAARWAAALGKDSSWTIPTKEQMERLVSHREVFNDVASRKDMPSIFDRMSFYWTSSVADSDHVYAWGPYGIRSYFAADAKYKARAVKAENIKK